MPSVRTARLANGLTTVLIEVPNSHQVLVSLMVRAGSRFDPPDQVGISHFLEHLLFRGNAEFPDVSSLFESFERSGDVLNAQTGVEMTEYFQVVHPDFVADSLNSLSAFVRTPRFADLEKERQIILDEILYDYNEQGELIRMDAIMAGLLWGAHPLGGNVTGTRETVAGFTPAQVRAHFDSLYRPSNAVLALAGHLDPEPTLAGIERHFAKWQTAPDGVPSLGAPPRTRNGRKPALRLVEDQDNQVRVMLSFPAPGYRSSDEIPVSLLASVLDDGPNSRLQRTVREELALVYYIGCSYQAYADGGQLDISSAVSLDKLEPFLDALFGILADLRDQGVREPELDAAKRRYRFDLEFSRDSLDGLLDRYAWPHLFSQVRTEEEEWNQVNAAGSVGLSKLAAEILAPGRLHVAAVGPVKGDVERILRERLSRY
jgi:predicted Zn-dependent peptidase